jgi:hypothetical protein
MTLEDQMEISALLGIPMADLADKAEDFLNKVHRLVRKETDGPRMALILMATAYLYHVRLAVPQGTDLLEEANKAIWVATELLTQALTQETPV